MSRELLLKGGLVVTVDDALGDVPDGDVLIRDGAIVAVGPGLSTLNADAEVIDCRGRLVIPGLVDTHRHVWQGAIGARVWNLDDEVGSLAPGKQADVTVIDMRSPHLDGYGDIIATMVLGAGLVHGVKSSAT